MKKQEICYCADNKYKEHNSCFTKEQIIDMAIGYNRFTTKSNLDKNMIPLIPEKYIQAQDTNKLIEYIRNIFSTECSQNDDKCIIDKLLMRGIIKNINKDEIFKPDGPEGKIEWLSNFDIQNIMKGYEKKYNNYKFIGAVASNCHNYDECVLSDFKLSDYKDKTHIGIIFNLDVVGQSGSHWVSFLIDIPNKSMYYVDSGGKEPNKHIREYIDRVLKELPNFNLLVNKKKFQCDSSECGVYSMNFQIRILAGEKYDDIIENHLNFDQINSCRNLYFYKAGSKQHEICLKCDPALNN